jgi:hypothetical protein
MACRSPRQLSTLPRIDNQQLTTLPASPARVPASGQYCVPRCFTPGPQKHECLQCKPQPHAIIPTAPDPVPRPASKRPLSSLRSHSGICRRMCAASIEGLSAEARKRSQTGPPACPSSAHLHQHHFYRPSCSRQAWVDVYRAPGFHTTVLPVVHAASESSCLLLIAGRFAIEGRLWQKISACQWPLESVRSYVCMLQHSPVHGACCGLFSAPACHQRCADSPAPACVPVLPPAAVHEPRALSYYGRGRGSTAAPPCVLIRSAFWGCPLMFGLLNWLPASSERKCTLSTGQPFKHPPS